MQSAFKGCNQRLWSLVTPVRVRCHAGSEKRAQRLFRRTPLSTRRAQASTHSHRNCDFLVYRQASQLSVNEVFDLARCAGT
jgi:hypothetical protein